MVTTSSSSLEGGEGSYAYVTLVTSEAYVVGALTLAHSLRRAGTAHALVVLVGAGGDVTSASIAALHRSFTRVVFVTRRDSGDAAGLARLGRPELGVTYTKLHVFDPAVLPGVARACFVDADALAVAPPDSVFGFLDAGAYFAAAPDVGWPDVFNSGVFVCRPDTRLFDALTWDALHGGSFDGGDQGLLNSFFSSWSGINHPPRVTNAQGDIRPDVPPELLQTARLPFVFNVTPSAVYSYLPAFHHFKQNIVIVHFAGHTKPWLQKRFSDGSVYNGSLNSDTLDMHALWWQTYDDLIKTWKSEDQQAKLQGANFSGNTNSQQGRLHFEVGVPKTADRSSQSFYANESPARYSWNHEELPVLINRQQQSQKRTPVEKAAQKIETLNLKSSSSSLKSSPTRSAGSPMKIFQAVTATQTVTPFQDPHMNLRSASALHILPSTEVASKNSTPPPPPLTTSAAAVQAEYAASAAPTSPTSPTTSVYSVATTIPTSPFAERPNGRSGSTDTQREPSLSPSTSPSRYEWNQAEFSTQQRRKSRLNQPVMIPPVLLGTTGGAGKQFVLNDKNESNVSLYDEEGISLRPTRKN